MSPAARALLFAVRVYQTFFSALMPSACKFYPSCSHYAADALRLHGARRGSWLALRRFLRCHPFTRGRVDFVPDPEDFQTASPSASVIPRSPRRPRNLSSLAEASAGISSTGFSLWGFVARTKNLADGAKTPQAEPCATSAKEARR